MNVFRLAADLAHLVAIAILLAKIWKTRSCAGISGMSQILSLIVFVCRYIGIFIIIFSAYNTVMKLFFIGSSIATVYLMWIKFKATYDRNHDTCRVEFLVIPAAVVALLINHEFTVMEELRKYAHTHAGTRIIHGTVGRYAPQEWPAWYTRTIFKWNGESRMSPYHPNDVRYADWQKNKLL
ncbi:ER lumen protein retaining receptor domain-containing protein [Ditylenchus destructor]|nr:ER lumen protein retaining receptor domain-containing protein [Ditylenchus destructor]